MERYRSEFSEIDCFCTNFINWYERKVNFKSYKVKKNSNIQQNFLSFCSFVCFVNRRNFDIYFIVKHSASIETENLKKLQTWRNYLWKRKISHQHKSLPFWAKVHPDFTCTGHINKFSSIMLNRTCSREAEKFSKRIIRDFNIILLWYFILCCFSHLKNFVKMKNIQSYVFRWWKRIFLFFFIQLKKKY